MAEEPQLQTIQQRIAALNSAQVGLNPNGPLRPQPAPKPPVVRKWTVNKPAHEANGSVADRASIGNEPTGLRQELLPPPVITRTGQETPDNPNENPPPLPSRPKSSQRSPPRRPSAQLERRESRESITSAASRSTTSTGTSRDRLRAPAFGEAELPPLPPKREARSPAPKPKPPPRTSTSPVPPLPPRRVSNDGAEGNEPPAPKLPPRRPSSDRPGQSVNSTNINGVRPPPRKVPPPPPSAAALDKIRQSSFAGLSKHDEAPPIPARPTSNAVQHASVPNNMPPPVPTASRPDLSKLLATKPRFTPSPSSVPAASSTVCMKCRDFSGPDTHAAQFPRQSLPSHDLRWLAGQLTGPFPSLTDKARAIFTWLHYNIRYDVYSFFNRCVQPSTPEKTLASGLAVCEGYAGLFAALATHAGLEAIVISGHGKGYGYQGLAPGSPLPPFESNHAWNAVKIDGGYWKLIDSCWGAGALEGENHTYNQRFDPNHFTMSNDEFGLRHYPTNRNQFYRDDGRPSISWEEYILGDPLKPSESPLVYHTTWDEHGIGERTFLPAAKRISVYQPGPIRFQFSLICEHWTLERHSKKSGSCVFLLLVHGIDGRQDDRVPFNHVRGSAPGGGGDFWYVDIADPRILGAPGQKLHVAALTNFGDRQDARGLTVQEYRDKVGRVGMAWAHIAEWELV